MFHVKHDPLEVFELSSEQRSSLQRFAALLAEIAVPRGLVAAGDRDRVFDRHIVDSLRAARLFTPADRIAVDLGTGAGLPGLVLAIALPSCALKLVESRAGRIGFLERAVEELGLSNVAVVHARVEDVTLTADVATARAFRGLGAAWAAAYPLLRTGGRLIYYAGEGLRAPEEQAAALRSPAPAAAVASERVLENWNPLVIMTRG